MSYFPNQGQQTTARSQSIVPASDGPQFPTGNIENIFRVVCDSLPTSPNWSTSIAGGDLLLQDGNANGAHYWVLSKSPFTLGTESKIDGLKTFKAPVELSLGLHRSQAALNQEFAVEVVDDAAPSSLPSEIAILALTQSTTTLTVTTTAAHGLIPGMSIGIYGCADSRFNYGQLVVATVTSSTVFTATAGPGGTIQSLTASPATLGSPMIYFRSRLGGSVDGTSMIFENASTTNTSIYVLTNGGDPVASGTANGNHSTTVGTSTSSQSINGGGAYAFLPSVDYRLNFLEDRIQWHDGSVDSTTGTSNRVVRTSVCPDPTKNYKLRFRGVNDKGMTAPVGKISSVSKSGSTTVTVTFASNHGLTVDDYLVGYGVRDTTNFANLTTATKVSSVVSPTVITIVWGISATATSYGGYMSRVQGGAAQTGAITQTFSSVSTSTTGGVTTVVFIFSATPSGFSIGDYVEVYGARESGTGNDLLVDGTYVVDNILSTQVNLRPIGGTTPPTSLGSTQCGGSFIKRTDLRFSYIRVSEYIRERIEMAPRPAADGVGALPVNIATAVSLTASLQPSATLGTATYHKLISANTTNATSVKTSAGSINSLHISNTNATTNYYLKLYNKASAPTVGTDVPVFTFLIPPAGLRTIDCGACAIRLTTGIAYAITANAADADTTVIPAGEVIVNMSYT